MEESPELAIEREKLQIERERLALERERLESRKVPARAGHIHTGPHDPEATPYRLKLEKRRQELKDELAEAVAIGITDGSRPLGYATRQETAMMVKRGVEKAKEGV